MWVTGMCATLIVLTPGFWITHQMNGDAKHLNRWLDIMGRELDRVHKDIAAMHTERLNEWHEQHYKH